MKLFKLIFLLVPCAAMMACIQPLDRSASSSGAISGDDASPPLCNGQQPFSLDTDPTGQTIICPDGGDIPVALTPFPVFLDDGGTSTDPCDLLKERAHAIRQTYCAQCHSPAPATSLGGFDFCLDDAELLTARSKVYRDPAGNLRPMLVAGDPDNSWMYLRVGTIGDMPPLGSPHPPPSDISVMREWISSCLGAKPAPAQAPSNVGAGDAANSPDGDAGGSDAGRAIDGSRPPVDAGHG
ncbi:MAG: hypothetical protein M3O50_06780 [Myxococcota bacterium]|nr:hypothetical protein [Myxococcota bacterium]